MKTNGILSIILFPTFSSYMKENYSAVQNTDLSGTNNEKIHLYVITLFKMSEQKMNGILRLTLKDLATFCQYTCQSSWVRPCCETACLGFQVSISSILWDFTFILRDFVDSTGSFSGVVCLHH